MAVDDDPRSSAASGSVSSVARSRTRLASTSSATSAAVVTSARRVDPQAGGELLQVNPTTYGSTALTEEIDDIETSWW